MMTMSAMTPPPIYIVTSVLGYRGLTVDARREVLSVRLEVADRVRAEGLLWPPLGDREAHENRNDERARAERERGRVAVRRRVAGDAERRRKYRRGGRAAEGAADRARDGVHAGRDARLRRADVLDDQVCHRGEGEPDAGAENCGGEIDLPALVTGEREQEERERGEHASGEERRLRAEPAL